MMKIKALAPNSFKLIPSVTRESGLDLSFHLRHLLALIGGLVLAKKPLTRVYCLSLEHAGDSEAGAPSTEGNWQTGDSCPCHKGPAATTWPKALALMGVGTTSQKQTASGLSSEGQTLQADPREMGKKESACLLPDSRLFLWETRRLPSSQSPGLVNASSFGFGLQGGHLWSLPASPDLLSHVRCLSVWVSDGSWPPRPAFVFRSLLSCT